MNMFANRDAVDWFLDAIWPRIKARGARSEVLRASASVRARSSLAAAATRSRSAKRQVSSTTCGPGWRAPAVYVVPLRVGGGTRLKMVDAMAQGKAIVATTLGAEGIDGENGKHFMLADDPADVRGGDRRGCCATRPDARGSARRRARAPKNATPGQAGRAARGRIPQASSGAAPMNPLLKRLYDLTPVSVQECAGQRVQRASRTRSVTAGASRNSARCSQESQWWDAEKMGAYQDERLRAIVRHAYEHVPYYRELFDQHGVDVAEIPRPRRPHEASRCSTRDTIKQRTEDLKSRRPEDRALAHGHTSGTTGSPLSVYYDADMVAMNYAVMDRQYEWAEAQARRRRRSRRGRARQRHRAAHAEEAAVLAPQPQPESAADVELPSHA